MRVYSWAARRIPLLSGLTPLAFNRVTNFCFGAVNYRATAITHDGLQIEIDVNDYHGRILYLFGTNDPKVQALAYELLSPGDTFLDIGANYSTIGLYASRKVGRIGMVHLFEPQPHIADSVEKAIATGGVSNVIIHRVALLDSDMIMTMRMPPRHSGRATIIERPNQSDWNSLSIPVRNVATYVGPLVAGKSFGVKIDVEGAEPHLIPWIVAQKNLRFLIFEAAHHHELLFDKIRSAGLTIFGLRRTIFKKQLQHVDSAAALRAFHDLVAVRIDKPPHIISMKDLGLMIRSTPDGSLLV